MTPLGWETGAEALPGSLATELLDGEPYLGALLSGVAVCLAAGMTLGDALSLVEDEARGRGRTEFSVTAAAG